MQQASSALAELMPSRSTSNNVKIVCGGSSIKGRRPQQEDVLLVHCDSASLSSSSQGDVVLSHGDGTGVSIVGVFDGHGGKRCSRYASQHLPENFYAALGEIRSRCQDTGHGDELVGPALRLAYRITHEDFARMARGDAESVRPKTRQRLSEALEKARSLDGLGFDANGPTVPNMPPQHRTFPQPEDTSFAAIRNRMIQQRMSLGSRVWDDGSTAITCNYSPKPSSSSSSIYSQPMRLSAIESSSRYSPKPQALNPSACRWALGCGAMGARPSLV